MTRRSSCAPPTKGEETFDSYEALRRTKKYKLPLLAMGDPILPAGDRD